MASYNHLIDLTDARRKNFREAADQYAGVSKQYENVLDKNNEDYAEFQDLHRTYGDVQRSLANGDIENLLNISTKIGLDEIAKTATKLTAFMAANMNSKDPKVQQKIGFYNEISKSIAQVNMIGLRDRLSHSIQENFSDKSKIRLAYIIQNGKEEVLAKLSTWSTPQLRGLLRDPTVQNFMTQIEATKGKIQQYKDAGDMKKADGLLEQIGPLNNKLETYLKGVKPIEGVQLRMSEARKRMGSLKDTIKINVTTAVHNLEKRRSLSAPPLLQSKEERQAKAKSLPLPEKPQGLEMPLSTIQNMLDDMQQKIKEGKLNVVDLSLKMLEAKPDSKRADVMVKVGERKLSIPEAIQQVRTQYHEAKNNVAGNKNVVEKKKAPPPLPPRRSKSLEDTVHPHKNAKEKTEKEDVKPTKNNNFS